MSSLNKVILLGNLTRDPELRYTNSGTAVANFALATNRKFKDQSSEVNEEVTFIETTAWGKTAENVSKYMSKGRPLLIEGRLHLEQWEKDGQKRQRMIVIAETVKFMPTGGKRSESTGREDPPSNQQNKEPAGFDQEDDIPF